MLEFLRQLFDTTGFPPRWQCGSGWTAELGWLHIVSDTLIWVAYTGIPIAIATLIAKRRDFPFPTVLWLFFAFILFCGTTHLIEAGMFWWPVYRFSGLMKAGTAIVSLGTLVALVPFTRRALALPGMAQMAEKLQTEVEQRKRTEARLRRSEQRLALAMDAARIGPWEWTVDSGRVRWDERALALVRREASDMHGDTEDFTRFVAPEDRERVREAIEDCRTGRAAGLDFDFRVVLPDGSRRTFEARAASRLDDGRQIVSGVHVDVTEQRRSRAALELQAERMSILGEAAAENLPLDAELRTLLTRCAGSLALDVGWIARLAEAGAVVEYLSSEAEDAAAQRGARLSLEHEVVEALRTTGVWQQAGGDGAPSMVAARITVGGDPWGALVFQAADARPGGFAEADLSFVALAARFIGVDLERAQARDRLEQQRRELERSNQELGQFARVASHDLQEPLRKVAGFCEMLRERYEGKLDPDADRWIGYAVDGAQRMTAQIREMLAYSRVGRGGTDAAQVELDTALDEALDNLSLTIEERGARIEREPLPQVRAHRGEMVQLLQNLVGNAIKYSEGTPEIRVTATRAGRGWQVSVADRGIGIAEDHQEQIFAMFRRLHPQDRYPGSGIGLTICRKIVEHLGGRLWCESRPGEGSTFHFVIPGPEATP